MNWSSIKPTKNITNWHSKFQSLDVACISRMEKVYHKMKLKLNNPNKYGEHENTECKSKMLLTKVLDITKQTSNALFHIILFRLYFPNAN